MVILTTSYNCEKYIERCLFSLMSQTYRNFKCYITDDLSTDNTVKIIKNIIKDDNRFVLIENKNKLYQPGNYDQIIRGLNIDDDEICVEVDGDDWLYSSKSLSIINEKYKNENLWVTSGSFTYHDGRPGFAQKPRDLNDVRKGTFTLSHLRTWKSWLWKKIEQSDLKDENGKYWEVAGDLSFMYPMIEMSGESHFKFIDEILYVYNESNPLNDHKINNDKVRKTVQILVNKPKYKELK
jgi:glycosyltransferase involved in cell wall biosynthesis